jgi:hypothetical protein
MRMLLMLGDDEVDAIELDTIVDEIELDLIEDGAGSHLPYPFWHD